MQTPHDKPVELLRRFAKRLGWSRLQIYQHQVDDAAKLAFPPLITWYESGDSGNPRTDCFLQINEHPIGQIQTYSAAVYALRYRIYTGWHRFTLYETDGELTVEASRLSPLLGREWFATLPMRRTYRERYPAFTGYSWRRISNAGAPTIA